MCRVGSESVMSQAESGLSQFSWLGSELATRVGSDLSRGSNRLESDLIEVDSNPIWSGLDLKLIAGWVGSGPNVNPKTDSPLDLVSTTTLASSGDVGEAVNHCWHRRGLRRDISTVMTRSNGCGSASEVVADLEVLSTSSGRSGGGGDVNKIRSSRRQWGLLI